MRYVFLLLFLLTGCEDRSANVKPEMGCDGWGEIPSLVEGERCFLFGRNSGNAGYGGAVCWPDHAPFKPCVEK